MLFSWLLLLGGVCGGEPSTAMLPRPADALEVFACDFGETWDQNFDGWPNDWIRKRGRGYPHYVDMRIDDVGPPGGGRSLRVRLDGGAAAASSPPIAVDPLFQYVLEVRIRATGLRHDRAMAAVVLLDAEHKPLRTVCSPPVQDTEDWQVVRVGPIQLDAAVRFAAIALQVEPQQLEDLTGTVWFGDVWFARMPHIKLETNEPHQLFVLPARLDAACIVSGAFRTPPQIEFSLEDAFGRVLASATATPDLKAVPAVAVAGPQAESLGRGVARWTPPVPGPGWYRLRARLKGGGTELEQQLSVAVVAPAGLRIRGELGWSLPQGDRPLPLPALARLLQQAGIGWIKYPLWLDEDESDETVQRLSAFAERLSAHGIEVIGLLGTPPASLRERFGAPTAPAAEVFACDPKVWYPSIETTLTRLTMQVRGWQLGHDGDMSFLAAGQAVEKVAEIKAAMDRIAQDAELGIAWDWTRALPLPTRGPPAWRFLSLTSRPPLSADELPWYLERPQGMATQRFVMLEPLPSDDYALTARLTDLVERLVAAKKGNADAVFASDPFERRRGLMNADGSPGVLFVPWRTTALALGGAKFLGSLTLPNGSRNDVFARDDEAIIVVRNEQPSDEPLSLGTTGTLTDLWGRTHVLDGPAAPRRVPVDTLPAFVTGLSRASARWQLDLQLERPQLPSAFDRPHNNTLRLINPFPRGVHGRMTVVAPRGWRVEPREAALNLAGGEAWQQPLELLVPNTASNGRHLLRFDFELQADKPLSISVYRFIEVGLGDVYVELITRNSERGELEVMQRFMNETTTPVSFRCELFIPGRRSLKTQIVGLGQGEDLKTYRLENGRELLGQPLWLRAQEIGGPRVLNYRLTVAE